MEYDFSITKINQKSLSKKRIIKIGYRNKIVCKQIFMNAWLLSYCLNNKPK